MREDFEKKEWEMVFELVRQIIGTGIISDEEARVLADRILAQILDAGDKIWAIVDARYEKELGEKGGIS